MTKTDQKTVVEKEQSIADIAGSGKSKVERADSMLSVVSKVMAIAGGVGTLFVWLCANFYVGHVSVNCPQEVQAVSIKVHGSKGQEITYHSKEIQLMPGHYHLEITADDHDPKHTEVDVAFAQKTVVDMESFEQKSEKEHWWQFWRK